MTANIDLYFEKTPNGYKITIMLEELGVPYNLKHIDIMKGDQFHPDFLKISPNNKIPAIVDHDGPDGKSISIFESGAILLYLAQKYNKFFPKDYRKQIEAYEWLCWQVGGFGPFLGQAHHFRRFANEKISYAINRYTEEARRLWGVLDNRLEDKEYIIDEITIVDFACYGWATRYEWQGIELDEFANAKAWMDRMTSREAVKKGIAIGS